MNSRIHVASLVSRRPLADQIVEFVLALGRPPGSESAEPPAGVSFRPGQFVSVRVGTDADDNPVLRSYSIASPPDRRGELALVLRIIPGGIGSEYFAGLSQGDRVQFTGPMGFFVNELAHPGDAVYVATGTGIAPILPMIAETLARPEPGRVYLYWGLRGEEDLFWQDELAALAARHPRFSHQIYVSQPRGSWSRLRGRVTGPVLELLPGLKSPTFYLCGNGHMIDEVKAGLVARGVDRKRQIRTEAFFD